MIGDGKFQSKLETIEALLRKLKLFEERQQFPNKSLGAGTFRGRTYREIFEISLREFAYDFRLSDQSLLLFIKSGSDIHTGSLNYCYYEAPVNVMPYRDFVLSQMGVELDDPALEETLVEWGDSLRSDYETYVASSDLKSAVTPIRYDCKAKDYRCGIHPASHIHFGVGNHIRVATRRILNPLSFTLFILRQRYPSDWERLLTWDDSGSFCGHFRTELDLVHSDYWTTNDERELHLL